MIHWAIKRVRGRGGVRIKRAINEFMYTHVFLFPVGLGGGLGTFDQQTTGMETAASVRFADHHVHDAWLGWRGTDRELEAHRGVNSSLRRIFWCFVISQAHLFLGENFPPSPLSLSLNEAPSHENDDITGRWDLAGVNGLPTLSRGR